MPNTIYFDRTTVVTTPSVQDFNDATYGRLGHPFWGGDAGGTPNAITIITSPAPSALAAGQVYRCRIVAPNTTAVTVNANALGIKNLVLRGGGALVANALQVGDIIEFVYDSVVDQYQIIAARPGVNHDITILNSLTSAPLLTNAPLLVVGPGVQYLPNVVSGSVFRKNCIINGDMRVAQRGTSFAAMPHGAYSLDRWQWVKVGTGVHTLSRDTDVPTVVQAGHLITNSLKIVLTTADTAMAAPDIYAISQIIEGYNFQRIAQRIFTVSFWVKATLNGIYSIACRNGGVTDRSYVANFTINAANTWEYKSVTVPASPVAGAWDYTNGPGLQVSITLGAGSNYYTTAGAWQTGNFLATASQVNGVNTGATNFWFTDFQVEPGTVATEFEMLDFGTELALCQRYFWKSFMQGTAPAQNAGVTGSLVYRVATAGANPAGVLVQFPVSMRTSYTATFFNPSAANGLWRNLSVGDSGAPAGVFGGSEDHFFISNPQTASDAIGHILCLHATMDAEL